MSSHGDNTPLARLRENAMTRNWKPVIEAYEKTREAQKLKLNQEGDTALHLAVIDNQEETVEKLVESVKNDKNNYKPILEIRNERGNNPLHLAAMMGSMKMCHAIADAHGKLVSARNKLDETPLYLAAGCGNKDLFFYLYFLCGEDSSKIETNCRVNRTGDTVLHHALRNDQFDLACELIYIHEEASNWRNEAGFTPLEVLASKPTSFKSGSHIKGLQRIIYHRSFVKPLQPRSFEKLKQESERSTEKAKETAPPSPFPVNYQTCIHFFRGMKDVFLRVWHFKCHNNNDTNNDGDEKKSNTKNDGDKRTGDLEEQKPLNTKSARDPPTTNFPVNYTTCIDFFHIAFSAIMIIFGCGTDEIKRIRKEKEKHTWAVQVMNQLFDLGKGYVYGDDGKSPMDFRFQNQEEKEKDTVPYDFVDDVIGFRHLVEEEPKQLEEPKQSVKPKQSEKSKDVEATESAMLLAAKNGVIEIVKEMSRRFPLAIYDTNKDKKNVVLLAAEYRQPEVYRFLLKERKRIESLFRAVDHKGNSALHLAATARDPNLWRITGDALQLQWEVKWYNYVKESVPLHVFPHWNKEGETANALFQETHKELATKGGEWLYDTSESFTVVATLIATVAFATAVTIPGGNDENGGAILGQELGFSIFSYSSLIALFLSSTSVIMFLAIMTSRFNIKDFGLVLPWKLLIGLCCLYFSIIAMLVSFCSGHYFLIINRLRNEAILLYSLTFIPVAVIFAVVQLPLYFDLLQALLQTVPTRSAEVVLRDLMHRSKANEEPDDMLKMGQQICRKQTTKAEKTT
ncbi:Ankyrin repeat-containing protein ITN1, partial [Cucurbita argyrosperma subsp. sororia]